jgi:hypothetical protein
MRTFDQDTLELGLRTACWWSCASNDPWFTLAHLRIKPRKRWDATTTPNNPNA